MAPPVPLQQQTNSSWQIRTFALLGIVAITLVVCLSYGFDLDSIEQQQQSRIVTDEYKMSVLTQNSIKSHNEHAGYMKGSNAADFDFIERQTITTVAETVGVVQSTIQPPSQPPPNPTSKSLNQTRSCLPDLIKECNEATCCNDKTQKARNIIQALCPQTCCHATCYTTLHYSNSNSNNNTKPVRVAIVSEIGTPSKFQAQFSVLLYSSWKLWLTQRLKRAYQNALLAPLSSTSSSNNDTDDATIMGSDEVESVTLFAFCESGACTHMPSSCREVAYGRPSPSTSLYGDCFYTFLPEGIEKVHKLLSYRFLTSLNFLGLDQTIATLEPYDYLMRTDADAYVGNSSYYWYPKDGAAFGEGYMGWPNLTYPWLEEVASNLNLQHHHVHGMQSTYFLRRELMKDFSLWMVNLTVHFLENEFTEEKCAAKMETKIFKDFLAKHDKDGTKKLFACRWPFWHKAVSTLYAQNLAVNHLLAVHGVNPLQSMVTSKLDFMSTTRSLTWAQSHVI